MGLRKEKSLIVFLTILTVFTFGLTSQDKAKLALGEIVDYWFSGRYEDALNKINKVLELPVDPFDLPRFYYMRSKIEIDLGKIEDAFKDLRSMIGVSLGTPEIISTLKEMEFLTGVKKIPENLRVSRFVTIPGIKGGVEFFYTVEDMAIWGDKIYAIDRVDSRLLVYNYDHLERTINLPFHPLSIEASPWGSLFMSTTKGSIYEYNGSLKKIVGGMRSPILAGFDRAGKLWGMDGYYVFWIDENGFHKKKLSISMIPVDCEVNYSGFWILDALNRRIILISKDDFTVLRIIPLPVGIRAFEVTPLGNMFLLSSKGKVYYFKNMKELVEVGISSPGIVGFDYVYPFLMYADWENHRIEVNLVTEGEPFIVKVVSYKRKNGNVEVNLRIEGFNGEQIPFADKFLYAEIDGGRIKPLVEMTPKKVDSYKSSKDFLTDRLPRLTDRFGVDVLVPPDAYSSKNDIITLRSKGVRLFVTGKGGEVLKNLSVMSGGEEDEDTYQSWKNLWKVKFSYVPDVSVRVHTVSVGLKIFDRSYSDTFYLVDKGTGISGSGE